MSRQRTTVDEKEMNAEQVPTLPPDIVWRLLDDGAVLVSPEIGKVRVLNEVGTTIWRLIDGRHSLGYIQQELVKKYNVSNERARADLHTFMRDLTDRGLVEWSQ